MFQLKSFESLYYNKERIAAFQRQIILLNIRHKCSKGEGQYGRLRRLTHPYFYFHLPVIYYLRVLIPFTLFEVKFLATKNVDVSYITPNVFRYNQGV